MNINNIDSDKMLSFGFMLSQPISPLILLHNILKPDRTPVNK